MWNLVKDFLLALLTQPINLCPFHQALVLVSLTSGRNAMIIDTHTHTPKHKNGIPEKEIQYNTVWRPDRAVKTPVDWAEYMQAMEPVDKAIVFSLAREGEQSPNDATAALVSDQLALHQTGSIHMIGVMMGEDDVADTPGTSSADETYHLTGFLWKEQGIHDNSTTRGDDRTCRYL